MSGLDLQCDWTPDRLTLRLGGEARLETVCQLDDVMKELAARDAVRAVVVDLSGLEFMDSAATGSLLRLYGRMADRDGRLVLHSLPRFLARLLDRLGLDQFEVAPDAAAAIARL